MMDENRLYHKRSIRLKGYGYAREGAYFVTICTADRMPVFGEIVSEVMRENKYGDIVRSCRNELPSHYRNIVLDEFIIMPNHVHGIISIVDNLTDDFVGGGLRPPSNPTNANGPVGAGLRPAATSRNENNPVAGGLRPPFTSTGKNVTKKRHGLPEIVRAFKSFSARRINEIRKTPGASVWQQNYYEHIIRNENELHEIRQYIVLNSLKWELDLPHEIKESSLLFRISYERNRVRGE